MNRKYLLPLILAVTLVAGIFLGWLLANRHGGNTPSERKLHDVLTMIQDKYVEDVEMDSLIEMTIPLLLRNLDPHSSYIPAKDLTNATSELEGKISGIGISFQIFNDTLTVVEVVTGGPAEKVGVMPGDRIMKVDGKPIAGIGITEEDVFGMLRGTKGTKVQISVKRSNSKQLVNFDMVRDDIPMESVDAAYMLDAEVGYVKVSRFARNTYQEFIQALNKLRLAGARSFVIDLRNNSGGYMEPAVLMVNELLPQGRLIVSTKGRNHAEDQVILSDGTGAFKDFGVVVILNEFSASASEIFAGAVQDNDRGWVVGRRSFGKGLVQTPIMLSDSSEVRLTVQRYYTPSGRCIQKEYKPGDIADYDLELINRFNNGELLSADSVKLNINQKYQTVGGRTVYGGGGIMPDYFVPEDTANVTSYYVSVANKGLLNKFAYRYADEHRSTLSQARNATAMLKLLPSDDQLLSSFADYAATEGVPARWFYINISAPLIVNQIKALIARNLFGVDAYYQVINPEDPTVQQALKYASKPLDR